MFLCTQGDEKILLCYVLCLVVQSCPTLWSFRLYPCQTPLSMRFFGQEYWSGFPFPPPGGNTFTFGQNMMESTQNIFCLMIIIIQMPSSKHLFYLEEHKHLVKGFLHVLAPLKKWCSGQITREEFVWIFSWKASELVTNLRIILLFVYKRVVNRLPMETMTYRLQFSL